MIRTTNVNFDLNPFRWLSEPRVQQHLPRQFTLDYMNLIAHAWKSSATSGSDFVDGEFSCVAALKRVPALTESALDAMLDAELVSIVEGDRWRVDFLTPQTSHEALQTRAEGYEQREQDRRLRKQEKQDRAQHKRDLNAERQRRHRLKKSTESTPSEEREPAMSGGGGWVDEPGEPPF